MRIDPFLKSSPDKPKFNSDENGSETYSNMSNGIIYT